MNKIAVTEEAIARHINNMSKFGNLGKSPDCGFSRPPYSKEETRAMKYIKSEAEKAGLFSKWDKLGNLYIRTPGNWKEYVQTGSHLDTVPEGGNYDGVAGVISGLEAIKAIYKSTNKLRIGLELVVWRGEESGISGVPYKGSKGAFGEAFEEDILNHTYDGTKLKTAMKRQGYDPKHYADRRPALEQEHIDSIAAHIELHIEQGKKLESDNDDIGIVTSVRGHSRFKVIVTGDFDHSGATPMGTFYRKDANLAVAYMQVALDELSKKYLKGGKDLVQTAGVVNSDQHLNKRHKKIIYNNALTKVSGMAYFLLDIRSNNKEVKKKYVNEALETIKKVADEKGVSVRIDEIGSVEPLEGFSPEIQNTIELACGQLEYKYQHLPSGAGHDATVVAKQLKSRGNSIPAGMIFIPCRQGKSHCKEEFASVEAIVKGANVLSNALYLIASGKVVL